MSTGNFFRKALPYIAAIAVFYVVSAVYFLPQFEGKTLQMTDVQMYDGMRREIIDHRIQFGEDPQWTGSMFGGMPAFLITVNYPAMIIRNAVQWILKLIGEPTASMFLAMTGFWLMLLMCGVNPWLAIAPAIAYGLSTYNILIIDTGHVTKMRAIAFAPMMLGAVFYTFRKNILLGGGLTALMATLAVAAAHLQITYYFVLVLAAFWINELVAAIKGKTLPKFGKATLAIAAAAILAAGANFTHLWFTAKHMSETTRGGSELSAGKPVEAKGLDLEYATAWSYGVGESLNMMIPNFRGGGSSGEGFAEDGIVAFTLKKNGIHPANAASLPTYWGTQPFTLGPTYLGAVMVFMFALGMFVLPGRAKWWILAASLLGLFLALGRNMMWFTEMAFNILPGYNKFRAPATALVILQWSVPFVAALVMSGMWKNDFDKPRFMKGLWWSLGITGGIALFFALFGGSVFSFSAASDVQLAQIPGLVEAMEQERAEMLSRDCWRSLIFILLTAGVVWAFANRQGLKRWMFPAAIGVLALADLVPVNLRYVSHDSFVIKKQIRITPTAANKQILEDKEQGFRVLNTRNPFNEAFTSYFHRSVGGYHGAKLRRYQDMIDRYLSKFDAGALNMLNTKYFIVADPETGEETVRLNPDANGAAWFVERVFLVDGAAEEIDAVGTIDNKLEAVADKRFADLAVIAPAEPDSAATIRLVDYRSNYLRYETSSAAAQIAVFSEIFYDHGWRAFIDGQEVPYFRANYILRAMEIPAGEHVVEWKFRAPGFAAVEAVTLSASILILLWLASAAFLEYRNRKNLTDNGSGR